MALRTNTADANARAGALKTAYDGGTLRIYTGSQPASGDDAATGTLLVEITLPNPAFSAAASSAVAKTGTWQATATATGTAGWARMLNSGGTVTRDFAVGAELTLNNTSIVSGGTVTVNTCTLTQAK